ncbi:MAG: SurA N-terminal domain-containing protein, partial [Verrucomicrobiota bacterium]
GRPTSATRSDTSPALASVDGRVITAEAFRHHWEDQRMATNSPALREQVLEQLIQRSALAAAARREGLDQDPVVQQEIDLLLARHLRTVRLQPRMKAIEVTDTAVKEAYERDRDSRFTEPAAIRAAVLWFNTRGQPPLEERYRPRFDAVRTRFLADPSWIAVSNGFGALSVTNSEHRVTRFSGGDTGWLRTGASGDAWRSEVVRIAATLQKPGDLSEVVAGPEGLFLVRLIDCRDPSIKPLESVRTGIETSLLAARRRELEEIFDREILAATRIERFPQPLQALTNLATLGIGSSDPSPFLPGPSRPPVSYPNRPPQ